MRDQQLLGLRPLERAERRAVAEDPAVVALVEVAAQAEEALAAGGAVAAEDAVALGDRGDGVAGRDHRADVFVAEDEAGLDLDSAVVDVEVRAADAGRLDPDDRLVGRGQLRLGRPRRRAPRRAPGRSPHASARTLCETFGRSSGDTGGRTDERGLRGRADHGLLVGHRARDGAAPAGRGWTVYATARQPESIADLAEKGCGRSPSTSPTRTRCAAAVDAVEADQGAVGALVNNAGYSQWGALETLPMERLRAQFETNVFGLVRMCQLVLPGMRGAGRGRIVNISSMGGKLVFPGGGAYHATKYAVEALSDALRFEVAGFGVRVVMIEPGLITTVRRDRGRSLDDAAARPARGRSLRGASTPRSAPRPSASTRGRWRGSAAGRRRWRGRSRGRSRPKPGPRYRVTASARLALGQRRAADRPRLGRGHAQPVQRAPGG